MKQIPKVHKSGVHIRVSHLHFFWIFILFQAGMNACHTKEQEKYRSSMLCAHTFSLILTFVSYKHRVVAVGIAQGKSLWGDFPNRFASSRDECTSHSGRRKILVLYVLCLYLPAIFEFCVVQLHFWGKKSYQKIIMCEPNLQLLGNRKYPGIYMCYIYITYV